MKRTRASTRRAQDGCPLFIDLQTISAIVSKLASSDRASLALTCSLARTAVHSEVTALDFSRSNGSSSSGRGRSRSSSGSGSGRMALTTAQSMQLLQRCLQDGRWAQLESLVLPASFHDGICSAAALVAQRCPRLHALTFVGNGRCGSQPLLLNKLLSESGLLLQLRMQLTRLQLSVTRVDAAAAKQLAQARLDGLQELCLENNALGDQGFQQLLLAGTWPSLTYLSVSANDLTHAAGRHLAAATHLTALASLVLQANDITAAFAQPLAPTMHLRLTWLDLSGNSNFGNTGLYGLLRATQLVGGLRRLTLSNAGLGLGTIPELVAARHLSSLTNLNLWGNARLWDGDFDTLAHATHLSTLQQLTVGYHYHVLNVWYFEGRVFSRALCQMLLPNLANLEINISAYLYQVAMRYLAAAALPSLHTLRLVCARLNTASLHELGRAVWPLLRVLDLTGNDELNATAIMELLLMRSSSPALRCLVVPEDVNAGAVQARLARGAWAELAVVHD